MANNFDVKMSEDKKKIAELILDELELDDLTVCFFEESQTFHFIQDRRTVDVPMDLVNPFDWSNIRFLFRAVLDRAPAVWNRQGSNDWSGKRYGDPSQKSNN